MIKKAMSMDNEKRERFGAMASEFTIIEKNSVVQARWILEFSKIRP